MEDTTTKGGGGSHGEPTPYPWNVHTFIKVSSPTGGSLSSFLWSQRLK
jgi:hypothetical protein